MFKTFAALLALSIPAHAVTVENHQLDFGAGNTSGPNFSTEAISNEIGGRFKYGATKFTVSPPVGTTGTTQYVLDFTSHFEMARDITATAFCTFCAGGFTASISIDGSTPFTYADTSGSSQDLFGGGSRFFFLGNPTGNTITTPGGAQFPEVDPATVNLGSHIQIILNVTDPQGQQFNFASAQSRLGVQVIATPVPASGGFLIAAMGLAGWLKRRRRLA